MESRVGPDMTEVRVLVQFPLFGSKYLLQTSGNIFIFSDFITKSSVLLSKFMNSYIIIGFTKRIYNFYSWLHTLRNTQGEIHGTYLGNIYGIYKEYIRNIHKYLWHKMIRKLTETQAPPSAAPQWGGRLRRPPHPHWVCVSDYFILGLRMCETMWDRINLSRDSDILQDDDDILL